MEENYNTYNNKAYRFLSFEGLHKTIQSGKLRFTSPQQFNDPLDNNSLITPLPWNALEKSGSSDFFENRYTSKIFNSMYICCFSKEYDKKESYLMWAHYGNKDHKGVAFEIDFSKIEFLGNPSSVTYDGLVKKRDEITEKIIINKGIPYDLQKEIGLFGVTYKYDVWSYEKEVRLIVDTTSPNINSNFKKSYNEKHLLVNFDLGFISKVIFGINADKENEIITINMFQEKGLKPDYKKMRINPISLELESVKYIKE